MMIRNLVAERKPGWQLIEAGSGDEAIQQMAENMPDCVTMDINMPGMDGLTAAVQIKKAHPKVRIVLLSANIQEGTLLRAQQIGVDFVAKPITAACIDKVIACYERP